MKPLVMPRDEEDPVIDFLDDELDGDPTERTVGVGVPVGWTSASPKHLQVVKDAQFMNLWPVATVATIRLVARAATTSEASDLCEEAFGRLCAHNGDDVISNTHPLLGVVPGRDPQTQAELAAATVRVTVRTEPLTGS